VNEEIAGALKVAADVLRVIPWAWLAVAICGLVADIRIMFQANPSPRLKKWADRLKSMYIEMIPWIIVTNVVYLSSDIARHKWDYMVGDAILVVWSIWVWHRNDDDRWKRRRKKLVEKVKRVGSRLVTVPARG
jgi:hypothetical protein